MALVDDFPRLAAAGYREMRGATARYNCIAWAFGDDTRWWEPVPGYYWPPGYDLFDYTVDTLAAIFTANERYDDCQLDASCEPSTEKVAIYAVDPEVWEHGSRQLPSGVWTSKIGQNVEIEHNTLEALYDGLPGSQYGTVARTMKRPRP